MIVQFISHYNDKYSYLDSIKFALEGGCKWIQLRIKDLPDSQVYPIALKAKELCLSYSAKFIIDDRVELVKDIQADGVHLGKNDMPIAQARKYLGNDFIIGGTANTFDDVLFHYKDSANYIGCGPFRFTTTKQKLSPILGLEGYRNIVKQMRQNNINLPIVAIGGIEVADIPQIMQTGVDGIAISGVVLRADNPASKMKEILRISL